MRLYLTLVEIITLAHNRGNDAQNSDDEYRKHPAIATTASTFMVDASNACVVIGTVVGGKVLIKIYSESQDRSCDITHAFLPDVEMISGGSRTMTGCGYDSADRAWLS